MCSRVHMKPRMTDMKRRASAIVCIAFSKPWRNCSMQYRFAAAAATKNTTTRNFTTAHARTLRDGVEADVNVVDSGSTSLVDARGDAKSGSSGTMSYIACFCDPRSRS